MNDVKLKVNGRWYSVEVQPTETLVYLLRKRLGLTGTKESCGQGECGACTVLLDNKAVNACLVLAVSVDGHEVTTIEGLAKEDALDPIQAAFIDYDASHCGFCTPGMIMSAKGLLHENARPQLADIQTALAGNLCRCTGYKQIIEAIKAASASPGKKG